MASVPLSRGASDLAEGRKGRNRSWRPWTSQQGRGLIRFWPIPCAGRQQAWVNTALCRIRQFTTLGARLRLNRTRAKTVETTLRFRQACDISPIVKEPGLSSNTNFEKNGDESSLSTKLWLIFKSSIYITT